MFNICNSLEKIICMIRDITNLYIVRIFYLCEQVKHEVANDND